jgi:hypothetical protein
MTMASLDDALELLDRLRAKCEPCLIAFAWIAAAALAILAIFALPTFPGP